MKVPLEDLQIAFGHEGGHVWRSMEIVRPSQSTRSTHHVQKDMSCRKVWNCISSNALELLLYDMFLQFYHYVVGRTSTRKYPHLLMNPCFNRLIPSNPMKTPYFSWWNSMSTISAKFLGRWFPWFPMISHDFPWFPGRWTRRCCSSDDHLQHWSPGNGGLGHGPGSLAHAACERRVWSAQGVVAFLEVVQKGWEMGHDGTGDLRTFAHSWIVDSFSCTLFNYIYWEPWTQDTPVLSTLRVHIHVHIHAYSCHES